MARIRMITPGFFDDPDIADLTPMARLFFVGLWCQADREGRLVADMRRLKARIFPFDDVDIYALAVELHGKDMVRRYQDDSGTDLFWVRQFTKHQRPHPKEQASVIVPYDESREKDRACRVRDRACKPDSGVLSLDSGVLILEGSSATADAVPEPALLTFPTVGTPSEWHLTESQVAQWAEAYPQTDILAECRKALAWLQANKRKTAGGMPRFLVAWFGRAANGPVGASYKRPSPDTHGRTGAPPAGKYAHITD